MSNQAFRVQGNANLSGSIQPQGAKNEALQIISAVLLTDKKVTIKNIPNILDINKQMELLTGLGVKIEKLSENDYTFQADDIDTEHLSSKEYQENAKKIRGSVMLLGPMLARFKKAFLPKPGGDKIGRRRLDTHFLGFEKLGASFNYNEDGDQYYIGAEKLKGSFILMDEISVTGTANVLMAAVMAEGITQIYNAACEPYLQQLCKMLNNMGARISGVGSNLLTIHGVESLGGTEHTILPDMIEIGSFIGLAAMTKSNLTITNVSVPNLGVIPSTFEKLGIQIDVQGDNLYIPAQDIYEIQSFIDGSIMTIYDAPWPGFTPDLLSIILVVATQAKGSILIHQKMFESRLFFVDKLIDMGAQIILCDPHRATVIGLERKFQLRGIRMSSPDIRAGVSLLIAALSAKSESIISNISQIDRGYQNIDGRLNALGAQIERIEE
ncbi:MAG TPA: UDP-N-acetylglucosamine 1-carboxyvinyltransferase [Saprospiraceae bacterium]|jgi:UDP-N-acetylglucosamine 1-carboxyvinyltransferase|nr:UDP-N-acetylglucosamine 1-carboxyvinyltransferase [Saprospiraceae bacterium]MBK9744946.1 UDP-N-acetylglucosamine 1-carboxyvinyltransferase [Saprospiraceae bacterium]HMT53691.1 UDP-N-acetylglucosamine 1-carboxyvinyltransferase [Saprospiraceae bacterium]